MNIHALIDRATITTSAWAYGRKLYFREGIEAEPLAEQIAAARLSLPAVLGEGYHGLIAETLHGPVEVGFRVAQWRGDELPTLIYHHGSGETPYDISFRSLLPHRRIDIPANLIVVRAAYHTSMTAFLAGIASLRSYMALLASSTRLIDALVQRCRELGAARTLVTGTSLGGFVANLHHAFCNSADVYVPHMAGDALGAVFCSGVYRKLAAEPARENPAALRRSLDFGGAYAAADHDKVFPVMARYDQIVQWEEQTPCYGQRPILALDRGHITGALTLRPVREHLLGLLSGRGPSPWARPIR